MRYRDQDIKAKVWNFPVMTEQMRLISYLLWPFYFPHPLARTRGRVHWTETNLFKYLHTSFSFSYWKYCCNLSTFVVDFAHWLVAFTRNSKEPLSWEKFSVITRKSCPLSSQSERAYYCSHIINDLNECQQLVLNGESHYMWLSLVFT